MSDWTRGDGDGLVLSEANGGGLLLAERVAQGTWTSAVVTTPFSFIALGGAWHADEPGGSRVKVAVRRRAADGQWPDWEDVERTEDWGLEPKLATSDLLFGPSLAYQYRLRLESGAQGQSPSVWNVRWTAIDAPDPSTPAGVVEARGGGNLAGRPALV